MAEHLDSYLRNWNRIHKQTARIMALAPDDKYDWKPAETAMTLGELMNHLWLSELGLAEGALAGERSAERPAPLRHSAELVAAFDKSHAELAERVAALTPEQLAETVTPFGPEYPMQRRVILTMLNEHEIHHRGQLYVYLRMVGCELPPLYG
jgi:uncharacterized damage-inducible protein DinB